MKTNFILCGALCLLISNIAQANFNDSSDGLPEPVKHVWNATMGINILSSDNEKIEGFGSGFIVGIKDMPAQKIKIYFLTARHVLSDSCSNIGMCDRIRILPTTHFSFIDPINESREIDSPVVIINSIGNSTLFSVDADANWAAWFKKKKIQSVSFEKSCASSNLELSSSIIYNLGMPILTSDKFIAKKYANSNLVIRRWSSGAILGFTNLNGPTQLGTRAQVLPGMSGGPTVNGNGELVGIIESKRLTHNFSSLCNEGYALAAAAGLVVKANSFKMDLTNQSKFEPNRDIICTINSSLASGYEYFYTNPNTNLGLTNLRTIFNHAKLKKRGIGKMLGPDNTKSEAFALEVLENPVGGKETDNTIQKAIVGETVWGYPFMVNCK
ncbi:MAG: trypsin-like peptidase domain-containing protein [Oligoflexia bacterium]|nr:trypsin-like peptidase domain-containing protein [Oligoflexia bacterium]